MTLINESNGNLFLGIFILFLNKMACVNLSEIDHLVSGGIAFGDHSIWKANASTVTECARMCLSRKPCLSFNFHELKTICELNDEVKGSHTSFKTGDHWIYSEIRRWPSQIDPHCFDRPCSDDEVCVPGVLTGEECCSFTCLKLYNNRCPLLDGIVSHGSRLQGTMLNPSCRSGYRLEGNSDAIICQANYQWNISEELSCNSIHGSTCQQDDDCVDINGRCYNWTCSCDDELTYDDAVASCKNACSTNWVLFESSCYLLGSEELSYTAARNSCLDLGGSLVQVDTVEERTFLYDKMRTTQPQPAIGYWNDLYEVTGYEQERWRETNDPLDNSVADWIAGQPDDKDGTPQKCTIFYKGIDYKWADFECEEYADRKAHALCERRI